MKVESILSQYSRDYGQHIYALPPLSNFTWGILAKYIYIYYFNNKISNFINEISGYYHGERNRTVLHRKLLTVRELGHNTKRLHRYFACEIWNSMTIICPWIIFQWKFTINYINSVWLLLKIIKCVLSMYLFGWYN